MGETRVPGGNPCTQTPHRYWQKQHTWEARNIIEIIKRSHVKTKKSTSANGDVSKYYIQFVLFLWHVEIPNLPLKLSLHVKAHMFFFTCDIRDIWSDMWNKGKNKCNRHASLSALSDCVCVCVCVCQMVFSVTTGCAVSPQQRMLPWCPPSFSEPPLKRLQS